MSTSIEHFDLSGRKAMVVGVEHPAGAAIARAYAEAGADVALCVLKADEAVMAAKGIQKEVEAQGGQSGVYVMDVALGRNVQVTTRQVAKELGGLDIVASCPDLFLGKSVAKTTDAELLQVMTHNFNSQFFVARSAAGELTKNEAGGNLILVSHILGERGAQNTAAYAAAHAATQSLVRSLSQELGESGVTVNGISLGWMDWMQDRIDPQVDDAGRSVRFSIMKRAGEAEEAGPMAVWLSGSAAGYVSGQVFTIDGGLLQHL